MVLSKRLKSIDNDSSAESSRTLVRRAERGPWALVALLIAFVAGSAPVQAGHHDIQCPGSRTLKLCRDGGNCKTDFPDHTTDTNDVLHFLGVSPGDQVSFSITNDSAAAATVDLKGQGNTSFSQILTGIASKAAVSSDVYTVASGDEPRASIKIDLDHVDNPSPTAITYTASCTASEPPANQARIIIYKSAVNGDDTFAYSVTSSDSVPSLSETRNLTTIGGYGQTTINFTPTNGNNAKAVTITEQTPPSGWNLTSLSCVDGNNNGNDQTTVSGSTATVKVRTGEVVSCFYTNTKQVADLTIDKFHSGNATQGQTGFQYTLRVSNSGTAATSGPVTVTDTLPSGLTATALSGSGWTCTLATGTCTRSDALAAGSSYPDITLTVDVASNAAASVTNTAVVSGGGETDISNNEDSDPTTVEPANGVPDLTIDKFHSGNATQGQTGFQYTLRVSNSGTATTSEPVTVTDTLPAGLTATALSGSGWTCTLATGTCTRSDPLAAGSSYPDITMTVDVASNAAASVTNTAVISGGGDTDISNNEDSDATTVNQRAGSLTLTKSASSGSFQNVGEIITYTYVVRNDSGAFISNVRVTDDKVSTFGCGAISLPTSLAAGASLSCIGLYTITEADMEAGTVTNNAQAFGDPSIQSNIATVSVRRNDAHIRERTQQTINNFLQRRTDLLLSEEPDRNRFIRRFTGALWGSPSRQTAGSDSGSKVSLTGDGTAARFAFSTGLRQMAADARAASEAERKRKEEQGLMALGRSPDSVGSAEELLRSGWDFWVEGHYAHFDDDRLSAGSSGNLGVMYVGADYLLTPAILIGALIQFDWMEDQSSAAQTATQGNGWLVGPYVSAKLSDHLFFDARVAWGQSDNSVDPLGFYTDRFDTDRWLAKSNLTGNWTVGDWRFTPSLGVAYIEETQEAYTNTLGILIPGQSVSLGRVTFGPEIGYQMFAADGTIIEPHAAIIGMWDFDKPDTLVFADEIVGTDDFRGRVQAGVLFTMPSGYTVRATGSYDGLGSDDFDAYGGQLWVNMPLN